MALSLAQRWELWFLVNHPLGPHHSPAQAGKYVGCSTKTARKWATMPGGPYEGSGEGAGRPRATTTLEDKKLLTASDKGPSLSSAGLQKATEVSVSPCTIRRRLNGAGKTYMPALPKPLLTAHQVTARLTFARANADRDWNKVVWSDEATFWLGERRKKVWTRKGHRVVQHMVKHPLKVHVWGCFSSQGWGRLYTFTGNLNSKLMNTIYQKALLPTMVHLPAATVFQEDNDPKHRSKVCCAWKADHDIECLDWPSCSPDLNPIENVWALLKAKVDTYRIRTVQGLKKAIHKEWKKLPKELAQHLADSMPRRLAQVIDAQGDYCCY